MSQQSIVDSEQLVAIKVENISKVFKLPHEKNSSIKTAAVNFYKRKKGYELQEALNDVSFEVRKGDFFGIVGRNGSGKSTLLKLLAGIYTPTSGTVNVNGSLTPFIELGVGFNTELTGRENIFLNGALLGFSRKEMQAMYKDIVSFAELEKFMDQKLKNYSSGMQVRLAFSIAIRAQSDILLIDEVLAVGDERFQNKCLGIFEEIKKSGRTVVFVSHDMESIKRFCSKSIVLNKGKVIFHGNSNQAAVEYVKLNFPETIAQVNKSSNNKIDIKLTKINNDASDANAVLNYGDTATIAVKWKLDKRIKNVGIAVYSESGAYIFGSNTILEKIKVNSNYIEYDLELKIAGGNYYLQVGLFGDNDTQKIHFVDKALTFRVLNSEGWQGLLYLDHEWRTKDV